MIMLDDDILTLKESTYNMKYKSYLMCLLFFKVESTSYARDFASICVCFRKIAL